MGRGKGKEMKDGAGRVSSPERSMATTLLPSFTQHGAQSEKELWAHKENVRRRKVIEGYEKREFFFKKGRKKKRSVRCVCR